MPTRLQTPLLRCCRSFLHGLGRVSEGAKHTLNSTTANAIALPVIFAILCGLRSVRPHQLPRMMLNEPAHKSHIDDYASYEAERGVAKFLQDILDKIWYNSLGHQDLLHKGCGARHHGPP
jgi:hypothetical protein